MDNISTLVLAGSLFIIMFGMGLSLTLNDFKEIFIEPRAIITGLVNQLLLLPVIGFVLIAILPVPGEIAIGIIILAACPGGPTSNLMTHLAKGDLALSVSLTAISSFITLLTIPFIINLGLQMVLGQNTIIQLPVVRTILQVFVIVIIPIIIGMTIKSRKPTFAEKMDRPVRIASAVVFILVLVAIVYKEKDMLIEALPDAGLIAVLLNVITMGLGLLAAKLMRLSFAQAVSISIESGIQNGTLAISIATVLLGSTEYAVAPAVYGVLMFVTGGVFIMLVLRKVRSY